MISEHGIAVTSEEVYWLPRSAGRFDLVAGRLRPIPFESFHHGMVVTNLSALLGDFLDERRLGKGCVGVGFVVARNPDTVLGADEAFVRGERVPIGEAA